jgi:hypothetical protein
VDPATGAAVEPGPAFPPDLLRALPVPREQLVRNARVYGFHGTLKAPFRLADDIDFDTLDAAVAALARMLQPVPVPRLGMGGSLRFVALRPGGPSPALDALAAACVTQLDALRAPLTAAELARRRRADLDTGEEQYLRQWGYPYVLDRFRFHMTLTIALSRVEAEAVVDLLAPVFEPHLDDAARIEELCLFGDPGEGQPFRLLRRYPLGGAGG